ncbi:unnamed protein product, partial [Dicrocoelium dendriticum]
GCEIALAKFSLNATLQSNINVFIAFAPAVYLGRAKSPLRLLAPLDWSAGNLLRLFNHGEFLPEKSLFTTLGKELCTKDHAPILCENLLYLVTGYGVGNTNVTRLPVYLSHASPGTSTKNVQHYAQSITSGKFQRFDYGIVKNLLTYVQIHPPEYDLSKITVPTAIFHGGNDSLVVEEDINQLALEINKTLIGKYLLTHYQHLDFIWGLDAGYVLYPSVLDILQQY